MALREVAAGGDPSLSLAEPAHPPARPTGASPLFLLLLAGLEGFAIGSLAAVLRQALGRSVRDEREAAALYPLPVLARVALRPRGQAGAGTDAPWFLGRARREALRTLLGRLDRHERGGVAMIASACHGDGRTTAAIDLAAAIAQTGNSVVLLDFDLRRPAVGRALGVRQVPLGALARADFQLIDALVPAPGLSSLSVLATKLGRDGDGSIAAVRRRLPELIDAARRSAAWIVVDTAPVAEADDALAIAPHVDDVVVVIRPGATDQRAFEALRERLEASSDRRPVGLVVTSAEAGRKASDGDRRHPPSEPDPVVSAAGGERRS
ncbi:MAG TPA: division plane positioning ATPase MipZ [Solirubrobacteraceae bacterium]|nr:division plane positioning ATPase MipZ [Solirubrobacteraceae bacterium]